MPFYFQPNNLNGEYLQVLLNNPEFLSLVVCRHLSARNYERQVINGLIKSVLTVKDLKDKQENDPHFFVASVIH